LNLLASGFLDSGKGAISDAGKLTRLIVPDRKDNNAEAYIFNWGLKPGISHIHKI
jgi:hypothetical protein